MMETLLILDECDGNASEAAERLGINQPSMSKRLAQLQYKHPQVKFAWIRRDGKSWLLTSEGQRVLPAVKEIVRLSREVQSDLDSRVSDVPHVSVACGQLAAQTFVRTALLRFRQECSGVEIRLSTPRGQMRIEGVETGLYDLAVVSHDEGDIEERYGRPLAIDHLFDDPWVLICAKQAPSVIRRQFESLPKMKVKIKQLGGLPLILPEEDSGVRRQLERSLLAQGESPGLRTVVQVGGWRTLTQFVQDGFGIGMASKTAVRGVPKLLPPKLLDTSAVETPQMKLVYGIIPEEATPRLTEHAAFLRKCIVDACKA